MSSVAIGTFIKSHISEAVLKDDKCKLLAEIKSFLDTSVLEETSVSPIRGKIERYNTIRDREDNLKPHIGRDPLDILPLEVWEKIIHECTPTDAQYLMEWGVDELIKLTEVSTKWRVTILQTPSFWRNIALSERTEDLEAKVALCLGLSGDCLLSIEVEIPTPCWETLGPMIGAQSFRIRSLTLSSQYPSSVEDSEIRSILAYFRELSSFQDFVCTFRSSPNAGPILQSASSILKIHNVDIPISSEIWGAQSISGLQYLHTNTPFTDAFPYLSTLKHLKEVSFSGTPVPIFLLNAEAEEGSPVPAPAPKQSLNWVSFNYNQSPLLYFDGFIGHLTSTLQHLSIHLYWGRLNGLLNVCAEMHKLRSLKVVVFYSSHPVVEVAITYPSSIRTLDLNLIYNEGEDPVYENNVGWLFKSLTAWAPSVEFLWIYTKGTVEAVFSYVKSLRQLRTLAYTGLDKESFHNEIVTLPSVEELFFDVSASNWLSHLSCPNALSLCLAYYISRISSSDSGIPTPLEVGQWSSLQSLHIQVNEPTWTDLSLPNVKRIALDSYGRSLSNPPNTRLCEELARRPTAFPSLEVLKMRFPPEWDILFIIWSDVTF